VDYVPWPEIGCSLAEARRRTADCELVSQLVELKRDNRHDEIEHVEKQIDAICLDHLKSGRLIAYGFWSGATAEKQLIATYWWKTFTNVDWQNSLLIDNEQGAFEICVFPPLLAPCRDDLLAGLPLAEVFEKFVLGDPEVACLARQAIKISNKFEAVFVRGRCFVHGSEEWPLAVDRWCMISEVHPDPAKRSKYDPPFDSDPLEVAVAADALRHRYRALISVLRLGSIEGRGVPGVQGYPLAIPRSIWSHEAFYLDARNGDILKDNPLSTAAYDRFVKGWIGVVLEPTDPSTHKFGTMFHGKPIAYDELLLASSEPQKTPVRRSKAQANVETKVSSYKACVDWLTTVISKNPNERISKAELWAEAQQQWPSTLSHRMFQEARTEAIRSIDGASAWAAAGRSRNRST
jgi:hypothetical protein